MPKIQLAGIHLYYESTGDGPPLLFIHGLGSSARDWELQTPYFSRTYQVITCDLRGHGQSDKPPGPYSIALFAADLAGLLRALALPPAHVVGISLGGGVALQLALDYPQLLRSLVVVNATSEAVPQTRQERRAVSLRFLIVRLLGMRRMGSVLSERLFPKEEHADIRRQFVERWAENDRRAYLDSLRAIVGWSVTDRLSEVNIPTLVIAADQDYTPLSAKEEFVTRLPHARLVVIEDSRHATPVEQPEAFNTALHRFLTELED